MTFTKPTADTPYFNFQFGLLCVSNFLFSTSFNMMIPELPGYLTMIGGAEYKGLIIALFTLMAGISRPFSGKLTDTVGRVPVMIFGSLVCVVCSMLYPFLTTVVGFLFLRFLHGFSTGFKPTATSAYGADVVHESRRGEALGALSIGYTLGSSAGPMMGSYLVDFFNYNTMFYVSAVFALGSVAILYNVKETLPNPQPFRLKLLKINRTEIFEKTALRPAIITLLLCFSIGTILTVAPDLSEHLGLHNKGLFFAFFTVASLLIRLVASKVSDRFGRVPVLLVSSFVLAIALCILAYASSVTMMMVGSVIYGLSWGINSPALSAWTVDLCAPENRGKAIASMYIALEIGIGTGALFSAWIYNNQAVNFKYAFLAPAFFAILSLFLLIRWNKAAKKVLPSFQE
ncbi:MAG: major facilitator superfamily [Chitinophagaceae bacterium]|nr:MAG: major facilitator superfamily [Chitinophagaceae bacterium]